MSALRNQVREANPPPSSSGSTTGSGTQAPPLLPSIPTNQSITPAENNNIAKASPPLDPRLTPLSPSSRRHGLASTAAWFSATEQSQTVAAAASPNPQGLLNVWATTPKHLPPVGVSRTSSFSSAADAPLADSFPSSEPVLVSQLQARIRELEAQLTAAAKREHSLNAKVEQLLTDNNSIQLDLPTSQPRYPRIAGNLPASVLSQQEFQFCFHLPPPTVSNQIAEGQHQTSAEVAVDHSSVKVPIENDSRNPSVRMIDDLATLQAHHPHPLQFMNERKAKKSSEDGWRCGVCGNTSGSEAHILSGLSLEAYACAHEECDFAVHVECFLRAGGEDVERLLESDSEFEQRSEPRMPLVLWSSLLEGAPAAKVSNVPNKPEPSATEPAKKVRSTQEEMQATTNSLDNVQSLMKQLESTDDLTQQQLLQASILASLNAVSDSVNQVVNSTDEPDFDSSDSLASQVIETPPQVIQVEGVHPHALYYEPSYGRLTDYEEYPFCAHCKKPLYFNRFRYKCPHQACKTFALHARCAAEKGWIDCARQLQEKQQQLPAHFSEKKPVSYDGNNVPTVASTMLRILDPLFGSMPPSLKPAQERQQEVIKDYHLSLLIVRRQLLLASGRHVDLQGIAAHPFTVKHENAVAVAGSAPAHPHPLTYRNIPYHLRGCAVCGSQGSSSYAQDYFAYGCETCKNYVECAKCFAQSGSVESEAYDPDAACSPDHLAMRIIEAVLTVNAMRMHSEQKSAERNRYTRQMQSMLVAIGEIIKAQRNTPNPQDKLQFVPTAIVCLCKRQSQPTYSIDTMFTFFGLLPALVAFGADVNANLASMSALPLLLNRGQGLPTEPSCISLLKLGLFEHGLDLAIPFGTNGQGYSLFPISIPEDVEMTDQGRLVFSSAARDHYCDVCGPEIHYTGYSSDGGQFFAHAECVLPDCLKYFSQKLPPPPEEKKASSDSESSTSSASPPAIHVNVTCDSCKMAPIAGRRWRCLQCRNFDYCDNCKNKNPSIGSHTNQHSFQELFAPVAATAAQSSISNQRKARVRFLQQSTLRKFPPSLISHLSQAPLIVDTFRQRCSWVPLQWSFPTYDLENQPDVTTTSWYQSYKVIRETMQQWDQHGNKVETQLRQHAQPLIQCDAAIRIVSQYLGFSPPQSGSSAGPLPSASSSVVQVEKPLRHDSSSLRVFDLIPSVVVSVIASFLDLRTSLCSLKPCCKFLSQPTTLLPTMLFDFFTLSVKAHADKPPIVPAHLLRFIRHISLTGEDQRPWPRLEELLASFPDLRSVRFAGAHNSWTPNAATATEGEETPTPNTISQNRHRDHISSLSIDPSCASSVFSILPGALLCNPANLLQLSIGGISVEQFDQLSGLGLSSLHSFTFDNNNGPFSSYSETTADVCSKFLNSVPALTSLSLKVTHLLLFLRDALTAAEAAQVEINDTTSAAGAFSLEENSFTSGSPLPRLRILSCEKVSLSLSCLPMMAHLKALLQFTPGFTWSSTPARIIETLKAYYDASTTSAVIDSAAAAASEPWRHWRWPILVGPSCAVNPLTEPLLIPVSFLHNNIDSTLLHISASDRALACHLMLHFLSFTPVQRIVGSMDLMPLPISKAVPTWQQQQQRQRLQPQTRETSPAALEWTSAMTSLLSNSSSADAAAGLLKLAASSSSSSSISNSCPPVHPGAFIGAFIQDGNHHLEDILQVTSVGPSGDTFEGEIAFRRAGSEAWNGCALVRGTINSNAFRFTSYAVKWGNIAVPGEYWGTLDESGTTWTGEWKSLTFRSTGTFVLSPPDEALKNRINAYAASNGGSAQIVVASSPSYNSTWTLSMEKLFNSARNVLQPQMMSTHERYVEKIVPLYRTAFQSLTELELSIPISQQPVVLQQELCTLRMLLHSLEQLTIHVAYDPCEQLPNFTHSSSSSSGSRILIPVAEYRSLPTLVINCKCRAKPVSTGYYQNTPAVLVQDHPTSPYSSSFLQSLQGVGSLKIMNGVLPAGLGAVFKQLPSCVRKLILHSETTYDSPSLADSMDPLMCLSNVEHLEFHSFSWRGPCILWLLQALDADCPNLQHLAIEAHRTFEKPVHNGLGRVMYHSFESAFTEMTWGCMFEPYTLNGINFTQPEVMVLANRVRPLQFRSLHTLSLRNSVANPGFFLFYRFMTLLFPRQSVDGAVFPQLRLLDLRGTCTDVHFQPDAKPSPGVTVAKIHLYLRWYEAWQQRTAMEGQLSVQIVHDFADRWFKHCLVHQHDEAVAAMNQKPQGWIRAIPTMVWQEHAQPAGGNQADSSEEGSVFNLARAKSILNSAQNKRGCVVQ